MPARMDFTFDLGGRPAPREGRTPREPMRILLLGDFSGAPASARQPLEERPMHRVDVDNLDSVLARVAPTLEFAGSDVEFVELEDFHPDALYRRLPQFQALRDARSRPAQSASDLLGGLLGKPAASAPANAPSPASGIDGWIRSVVAPHIAADTSAQDQGYRSAIDAATAEQMRALLHAPAFQSLESAWRGVQWLIANLDLDENLQLHLFDLSRDELLADVVASQGRLAETGLHRALVERERDVPGGQGWSLLCGLYRFGPSDLDIGLLAALGLIASRAGAPLVAAGDTALATGDAATLAGWNALRRSEAAPWLGLVVPGVLLRQPYGKGSDPVSAFAFEEIGGSPRREQFLWGAGSLAVALIVGRAFADNGWDLDPEDDRDIGDLPSFSYLEDGERKLLPCAAELLDARAATALLSAGLMPLQAHRNRNAVTVMRVQSVAEPAAALAGLVRQ